MTPIPWQKRWRYWWEAQAFRLSLALFGALPVARASALGGWLGRRLGPRMKGLSFIARRNLRLAFPDRTEAQREAIFRGMWDNLGRNLAEYAHLKDFYAQGRVEIVNGEVVEQIRDDGIGGVFFSAHLGNWELLPLAVDHLGLSTTIVYRVANNPISDRIIQGTRLGAHRLPVTYLPKTNAAMRPLVKTLREGGHLAMLIDQRMNQGITLPFFGVDTKTAPAAAQMAIRYRVPIVPACTQRLPGARHRVTFFPPMAVPDSGDVEQDTEILTRRINGLFEDWIRRRPEQWLWIHKRWHKAVYRD